MKLFRDQEDANYHSENALLLAERYGTNEEIDIVQECIEYRDKNGGYPGGGYHSLMISEITLRYFPRLQYEVERVNNPGE
jgi:hypothetical protein